MWRNALHLLAKRIAPLSARSTRRPTRELPQRRGGGSGLYSLGALRGALRGSSAVHSLSPAMRKQLVELLGSGSSRPKNRKSASTIRSSSRINTRYVSRYSGSGDRGSSKKRSAHRSKKHSQRKISSSRSAERKSNSRLHSRSKKVQTRRSKSRTVKRRKKSRKASSAKRVSKKVLSIPSSSPSVAPLVPPTASFPALASDGALSPSQSAAAATATDSSTVISNTPRVPSSAFSSSSELVSPINSMPPLPPSLRSSDTLPRSTGGSPSYAGLSPSVLGSEGASTGSRHSSSLRNSSISSFLDPPPRINYHLATAVATVVVPAVANEMLEGMRHVVTRASRNDSAFDGPSKTSGQQMEEYYMASKGPLFATAVIAGTNAVKLSSTILPLCQPVGIQKCSFTFRRRSVPQSVRQSPLPHRVVLRKRATPPSSIVPKRSEYSIIYCFCTVATSERKAGGVEMEALAGATVAATTMYDMLRHLPCSQEDGLMLGESFILAKRGGQSDFIKLLMSEPSPPSPALIPSVTAAPPPSMQFNRSPSVPQPQPLQSFSSSSSTPSFHSASVFNKEKARAALPPIVEPQSSSGSFREEQDESKKEVVKTSKEVSQWKDVQTKTAEIEGDVERDVKVDRGEEMARVVGKNEVAPVRGEKSPEAEIELRESQKKRLALVEKNNGSDPLPTLSARSHDRNEASLGRTASSSEEISSPVQEVDNSQSLEQSSWTSTQRSSTANKKSRAPSPPVDTSTITSATLSPARGESPITRSTTYSGDVVSWWQSTPQERRLQEYNPRRRYGEGRLSPITLAEKKNPRGKEKQETDEEKKEDHIVEEGTTEGRASSITSSPSRLVSSSASKRLKRKKVVRIVRKSHPISLSPQIPDYIDDEVEKEDEGEEDQAIKRHTRAEVKLSTERDQISREKISKVAPKSDSGDRQKVEKPPVKVEKKATRDSSKRSATDHGEENLQDEEVEEKSVDSNSEHTLKSTKSTSISKESSGGKKKETNRSHSKDKKGSGDRAYSAKEENAEEEYSPVSHSDWDTLTTRIEDDEDVEEDRTEDNGNLKVQEESDDSINSTNGSDEFSRGSGNKTKFTKGEEEDDVEDFIPPPPREKPISLLSKKKKKMRYQ